MLLFNWYNDGSVGARDVPSVREKRGVSFFFFILFALRRWRLGLGRFMVLFCHVLAIKFQDWLFVRSG